MVKNENKLISVVCVLGVWKFKKNVMYTRFHFINIQSYNVFSKAVFIICFYCHKVSTLLRQEHITDIIYNTYN